MASDGSQNHAICIRVRNILDGTLPDALRDLSRTTGFDIIEVAAEAIIESRQPVLDLFWVGDEWNAGISRLERLDAVTPRYAAVLVGRELPPPSIRTRVHQVGALSCTSVGAIASFLPLLVDAMSRDQAPTRFSTGSVLHHIRQRVREFPESLLLAVTEVLGELLDSDAVALVSEESDQAVIIERHHGVEQQPAARAVEWAPIPGLSHRALSSGRIEVVHSLDHDDPVDGIRASGNCYRAAIAVPYMASAVPPSSSGPSGEARTASLAERGAIHLYWKQPRVPTVAELREVAQMWLLVEVAVSWRVDRERLMSARMDTIRAFDERNAFPQGVLRGEASDMQRQAREALDRFVRRLLRAHLFFPGIKALWAWVSTHTFDRKWYCEPGGDEPPLASWAQKFDVDRFEFLPGQDGWALVKAVGSRAKGAGSPRLVALFANHQAATSYEQAMAALAGALAEGLDQLRRVEDRQALGALSDALTGIDEPLHALETMAGIVKQAMGAHGVAIWVTRHTNGDDFDLLALHPQHVVEPTARPAPRLARQVAASREWLLVDDILESEGRDGVREVPVIQGPRAETAVLEIHPASELPPGAWQEPFTSILLVPMRSGKQMSGVLAVWRNSSDAPFDSYLDVRSLQHLAPQIASATRRALQLGTLRKQLEVTARLARELSDPATTLPGAEALVVEKVLELAGVELAVLLRSDADRPDTLYYAHHEQTIEAPDVDLSALRALRFRCSGPREGWSEQIVAELRRCASLGTGLLAEEPLPLGGTTDDGPEGYVVCFRCGRPSLLSSFPQESVRNFLEYAGTMLRSHVSVVASFVRERISAIQEAEPDKLLDATAAALVRFTGADAVLVYHRSGADMIVKQVHPANSGALDVTADRSSLAWRAIESGAPRRVLDTQDRDDAETKLLNIDTLERVRQVFHWTHLRSILCCPLISSAGRPVGAIKLITADDGSFLGKHHESFSDQIAEEVAWELEKLDRRRMLEDLNERATVLSAKQGQALGREMVENLEAWCTRYLRPDCHIYIAARAASDRLVLSQGSTRMPPALQSQLQQLSMQLRNEELRWRRSDRILQDHDGRKHALPVCGIAMPCMVSNERRLSGHFFVVHSAKFAESDAEAFREAAREFALLLDGERLRQQWIEEIAVFRHEFLAPAQGLQSAARAALLMAQREGIADDKLLPIRARIDSETESIKRWRENQRLYFEERLDVRTVRRPLKPIVERCIERFRFVARERRIHIELQWDMRGSAEIPLDEHTIEVALSNLLDNACKYSFANQILIVGAQVIGPHVVVWIEDVGHPAPASLAEISRPGRREWHDHARTIQGQGLGLAMTWAIIKAHEGELSHTSEPVQDSPSMAEPVTERNPPPHKVRFSMRLPHRWRL
jgi:signal transduction histidine kinase